MYDKEIAECRRLIALGYSLNSLRNNNPDFKAIIENGFLHDEVLAHSLNINKDKAGTIAFLKGVAVFNSYLSKVERDAAQAQIDLQNYLQLL